MSHNIVRKLFLVTGLVMLFLTGCGGIRAPGLLSDAQLETLAQKVDSPLDPEAEWAEKITEDQWQQLKKFITIFSKRLGYRQGWRDGWDARGEKHER